MLSPLLATKIYIPSARPNRVPRPRLIERLNILRPLTLIAAPAGFGKTTLLSDWIPQSEHCVTWLSLDEDDNDPLRFWVYLVAALQKLQTNLGEDALVLLQSPQPPPITAILSMLINEIASFPDHFSIVLDDYHLIKNQLIHEGLTFLLDHLPPQMHLILTTRVDPPLPIARLRARNQLIELRATDLRFAPDEATVFLNELMGLRLSMDEIAALESRTEGWVAGLQLAALSMQGRDDVSEFIQAFSGSHKHVLTYLAEEVLERRPEGTLNFLLQTSILDRLCAPLCDAVTGGKDSQELLQKLEQANLFIVSLDNEGNWYRYHHLFADLLRHRLNQTYPDQVDALHRKASQWYEQVGLIDPAVQHALAAQTYPQAARLVEHIAMELIQHSELARLLTWVDTLPEDEVYARPLLGLYFGWALLLSGKTKEAASQLEAIHARLGADKVRQPPEVQGHTAAMQAYLVRETGDLTSTIALSRQALAQLPEADTLVRAMVTFNLAVAYYLKGDFEPASQLLTDIVIAGQSAQRMANTLSAVYLQAQLLRAQGSSQRALELCQVGVELIGRHGWQNFPAAGFVYVALGELLRERNELTAAAEYLEKGIKLGEEGGHHHISIIGHVWLASLRYAQGDLTGSRESIQRALQLVEAHQVSRFWPIPPAACYQARMRIAQGDLTAAKRWAQTIGLNPTKPQEAYLYEVDYLTFARLLIAQCNLESAGSLLSHLYKAAESAGRNGSLVEILILQAITFAAQENSEEALEALEQALILAEPEGCIRVFVDEGEAVRGLISAFRSKKRSHPVRAYTEKLLAVFEAPPVTPISTSSQPSVSQSFTEPLSARELEVSHLIAEGFSNQAIAQKLFLSTGTIKVHLKHIYGKLNVNSRTQAVARLRELHLL